jgi:hypothetical protein
MQWVARAPPSTPSPPGPSAPSRSPPPCSAAPQAAVGGRRGGAMGACGQSRGHGPGARRRWGSVGGFWGCMTPPPAGPAGFTGPWARSRLWRSLRTEATSSSLPTPLLLPPAGAAQHSRPASPPPTDGGLVVLIYLVGWEVELFWPSLSGGGPARVLHLSRFSVSAAVNHVEIKWKSSGSVHTGT